MLRQCKKGPNINKLQNGLVESTFNVNLANRFQTLQDMYTDHEDAWMHMRESYNDSAITVLGPQTSRRMDNRRDLARDRMKKRLQKDDSREEMSSDKAILTN